MNRMMVSRKQVEEGFRFMQKNETFCLLGIEKTVGVPLLLYELTVQNYYHGFTMV